MRFWKSVIGIGLFISASGSALADGNGNALGNAELEARIEANALVNAELEARIEVLEALVVELQAQITANDGDIATAANVLQYVSVDNGEMNGIVGPHFVIEGANVHIRSGAGSTTEGCNHAAPDCDGRTGLGNLIVGYNEDRSAAYSDDYISNVFGSANHAALCAAQPWVVDPEGTPVCVERSGSHNLIVGQWHNFVGHGGALAGIFNDVRGSHQFAAGSQNSVHGAYGTVTGGVFNRAKGNFSSIGGGRFNETEWGASFTSVNGGSFNVAFGEASAISGGAGNRTNAMNSAISGGEYNQTLDLIYEGRQGGFSSWIGGGSHNSASGERSSISGGANRTAAGNDCVLGDNGTDC